VRDSDVILWAPADAASMRLVRTVASSVGARFGLSVDDIDDLRLAVTEAASMLIDERPTGSTLRLRLGEEREVLRVTVTVDGGRGPSGAPVGAIEGSLAWQILLALGDDVRALGDGLETGFTFTTRGRGMVDG
jgi:serine/threonine-protein kinase RsbW